MNEGIILQIKKHFSKYLEEMPIHWYQSNEAAYMILHTKAESDII